MKDIVIIGDSGHAKVIEDIISSAGMRVLAKLDDKYESAIEVESIIKGPISLLESMLEEKQDIGVVIAIGSNMVRKRLVESLQLPSSVYITLVHTSSIVSPRAQIGRGSAIMPGVIINADTVIGDHVILNSACIVEHDCVVESYAHISPNATLTGGVCIGEGTHIGASATVIPLKKVGDWSIIGAGSVVTSDIQEHVLAVGVPAKVVKRVGL